MKRIIIFSIATLCSGLSLANDQNHQKCKEDGFSLLDKSRKFNYAYERSLAYFGSMKPSDFDKSACFGKDNILNNIYTFSFYQDKKSLISRKFKNFVAFDAENNKILIVMLDSDKQTYVLGSREALLVNALKQSFSTSSDFAYIDFDSKLTFDDIGVSGETRKALISQKLKLEKDIQDNRNELIRSAELALSKKNKKEYITRSTNYREIIKNGEGEKKEVNIYVELDDSVNIPLSKAALKNEINFTSEMSKIYLKNPYSYVPRDILVKQSQENVEISIRYTAKNSYNADVVGNYSKLFKLNKDGTYSSVDK